MYHYVNGNYYESGLGGRSSEDLVKHLRSRAQIDGALLIQPVIRNASSWARFTSGALASVRIFTAKYPDGLIRPFGACLRMPTGTAVADNFSNGGLIASIDMVTGEVGPAISQVARDGMFECDHHPDTKALITKIELPEWKSLLDIASRAHEKLKIKFVGWDVSLTEAGPCLIEGNSNWSPGTFEAATGRSLYTTDYPWLYDYWMAQSVSTRSRTERI